MASNSTWKRTRKLLNDIHLWLGIAAGLILFVVCLTGTVYTFHEEIDEFINSDKYKVEIADNELPVEELAMRLTTQVKGQVSSVTISADDDAYQFSVQEEGQRRGTTYLVNQYTGDVIGDTKSKTSEFFMVMFRLHRWLLLDTNIGRPIVGWSTVIFTFLVITGLVIWIPKKAKSWRQGLKVKWSGNWKRINHDLHNSLGFYSAIVLLIMTLTGLQWSFDWYRDGLRSVLMVSEPERRGRGEEEGQPLDSAIVDQQRLTVDQIKSIVDTELPFEGSYRIELPDGLKETISIRKYHSGFFASPASDNVSVNTITGGVTSKEVFADKPFNEKIAMSIKALHVGDVFGTFSKIIYFISCLIATTLPVTGTIIWLNKMKKSPKAKVR